jgi:hypothetical protein
LRDYAREAIDDLHPPPDAPQKPHTGSPAVKALFSEITGFQAKLKSEEIIQIEAYSLLNTL